MTSLSEGTPSLDQATRVANVRIEANDAPHGVVEFAQSSYNASEGSTTYLLVLRQFGTAGDIRVFYRFVLTLILPTLCRVKWTLILLEYDFQEPKKKCSL